MERYSYEQVESYIKRLLEYIKRLEEENEKLKKELSAVYKAYHTALGVDYVSEEDLYTNEDIEWHNAE